MKWNDPIVQKKFTCKDPVISPRLFYLEDLGKFKRLVFKLPKVSRGDKKR